MKIDIKRISREVQIRESDTKSERRVPCTISRGTRELQSNNKNKSMVQVAVKYCEVELKKYDATLYESKDGDNAIKSHIKRNT